jgi:hypothetical protein
MSNQDLISGRFCDSSDFYLNFFHGIFRYRYEVCKLLRVQKINFGEADNRNLVFTANSHKPMLHYVPVSNYAGTTVTQTRQFSMPESLVT